MQSPSIIPKPTTEYDLKLLRIFTSVVEHGGFAAAESALGVTRSTISVHMSNLEARMNLKLCLRGRGGFSLTEDGQAVYRAVIELFDSLNDFSLLVGSLGKELSGELVILCADQIDSAKQQLLAEVVAQVVERSPNLHIVLDNDTLSNIEKALLKSKAHVGIIPNFQQIEGISYQPLISDPVYLCCGKHHPLFNKTDTQISDKDLSETPAVHPGIDIDSEGREQLQKLNLRAKSYQFDTRKALVLSGKYIGYLPQSAIQQELNQGKVRIIQPNTLTYPFKLSLATNKNPREINKVNMLIEIFNNVFTKPLD